MSRKPVQSIRSGSGHINCVQGDNDIYFTGQNCGPKNKGIREIYCLHGVGEPGLVG